MTRRSLILAVILMASSHTTCVWAQVADTTEVQITLRRSCRLQERLIRVQDVADVVGGPVALRRQIAQLDLEEVDPDQQVVSIRRSRIALRLQLADVRHDTFRLTGADRVTVELSSDKLDDDRVLEALRAPLANTWNVPPESIQLRLGKPLADLLPPGLDLPSHPRINPFIEPDALPGRMRITCGVYEEQRLTDTFTVNVTSHIQRPVAITRRPLRTGDRISTENVYFRRQPMVGRAAVESVASEALDKFVTRPIAAGRSLVQADVSDTAPSQGNANNEASNQRVNRKAPVTIVAQRGGLRVLVRNAELVSPAKVGDQVRVRNLESNRTVTGRLVSPSIVEVRF